MRRLIGEGCELEVSGDGQVVGTEEVLLLVQLTPLFGLLVVAPLGFFLLLLLRPKKPFRRLLSPPLLRTRVQLLVVVCCCGCDGCAGSSVSPSLSSMSSSEVILAHSATLRG